MMKKLYAIALIFGLSAMQTVPAGTARAAETQDGLPEIFISEINWAGSALSNADEWLELTNSGSQSVDLGGWILAGAATSGDALAIADGFVIGAGSTALISNYAFENEKTTLGVEPNLVTSSLSLSNTAMEIMLALPDGTVIDEVTKDDQAGSSNPFVSMTRNADGSWNDSAESVNLLDDAQMGTPGIHAFVETTPVPAEDEPIVSEEDPEVIEEINEEEPVENIEDSEPVEDVEVDERETVVVCTTVYADTGAPVGTSTDDASEGEAVNESSAPPTDVEQTSADNATEPAAEESETSEDDFHIDGALSGDVRINEIVSDPEDGTEWVELYNFGVKTISMDGWSIADAAGKATTLEGVSLAPSDYYVIENPAGKLNNDSDTVSLLGAAGSLVDEMSYGIEGIKAPKKGESLMFANNAWIVTDNITKGAANEIPSEELVDEARDELETEPDAIETNDTVQDEGVGGADPNETTQEHQEEQKETKVIAIAEQTPVKTTTTTKSTTTSVQSTSGETKDVVSGVITAAPGLFGKQIAFIDGIQLYFHSADWPELSVGDVVKVTGERSESRGEPRLKITDASSIEVTGRENVSGTPATASALEAFQEGALVTLTGTVIERNGDKIVLRDETGDANIVAHANTGVSFASLDGSTVSVTGIVRTFDDGVRIYVRSQEDIQATEVVAIHEEASQERDDESVIPVARTQRATPWIGGGVVTAATAVIAYWYLKHRKALRAPQRVAA